MVVVSQIKDQALGKKTVDKLLFTMAKPKVRHDKLQKVKHCLTAFPNAVGKDRFLTYPSAFVITLYYI